MESPLLSSFNARWPACLLDTIARVTRGNRQNIVEEDQESLQAEIESLRKISYTAGLLHGDITIRTLLESLAEGVVVIDTSGRIISINQRMEKMFGYERGEIQGMDLGIFIPDRLKEAHAKHIKAYFDQPRIRPMGINLELTGKKKNGSEIPIEVSLSTLDVETGKLAFGFISDISGRRRAESELRERNKELDEFAQNVAHDLNNSITTLVGFSELLMASTSDQSLADQRGLLQDISDSSKKMAEVVREMLLFARVSKEDVELSKVDMLQVVTDAISRLQDQIDRLGAEVVVNNLELPVTGYAPWLEEVWFNYISNALRYGGSPPHIEIGCDHETDQLKFWVKDNGKGLAPDALAVVFDEASKERRKIVKGQGLGLMIAKRISDKLGGGTGAESEPGNGSKFYFTLPAHR